MTTYHVADVAHGGSDSNPGTELLPFFRPPGAIVRDNSSVSASTTLLSGDVVSFEKGSEWQCQQCMRIDSDTADNITFTTHGAGADPIWHVGSDFTGATWTRVPTTDNYYKMFTGDDTRRIMMSPVNATGGYDAAGSFDFASPSGTNLAHTGWTKDAAGGTYAHKTSAFSVKPWKISGTLGTVGQAGGKMSSWSEDTGASFTAGVPDAPIAVSKWAWDSATLTLWVNPAQNVDLNSLAQQNLCYVIPHCSQAQPWYLERYVDGVEYTSQTRLYCYGNGATPPNIFWNKISVSWPNVDNVWYTSSEDTQHIGRWSHALAIVDNQGFTMSGLDLRGGYASTVFILQHQDTVPLARQTRDIHLHNFTASRSLGNNQLRLSGYSSTQQMTNILVEDATLDFKLLATEDTGYDGGGGDVLDIVGGISNSIFRRIVARGVTHSCFTIQHRSSAFSNYTAMVNVLLEDFSGFRDNSTYGRIGEVQGDAENDVHMSDVVLRRIDGWGDGFNIAPKLQGANVTWEFSIFRTTSSIYNGRGEGLLLRGYVSNGYACRDITLRNNLFLYCHESAVNIVDQGTNAYPHRGVNLIYNNIFYQWDQEGSPANNFGLKDGREGTAIDTSLFKAFNNCFFHSTSTSIIRWRLAGGGYVDYTSVAAAELAEPTELYDNLQVDPLFVNPSAGSTDVIADFALSASSPLIEAGSAIGYTSGVTKDFNSKTTLVTAPDIGFLWYAPYTAGGGAVADVKVAVTTFTLPAAPNANLQITTTKLGGKTPKAAIVYFSGASTDGPALGVHDAHMRACMGFAVENGLAAKAYHCSWMVQDGVDPSATSRENGPEFFLVRHTNKTNDSLATFTSFIPNGIEVNYSLGAASVSGIRATIIFFAGDDVKASMKTGVIPASSSSPVVVNFGGTDPVQGDLLFYMDARLASDNAQGNTCRGSIGVATASGGVVSSQQSYTFQMEDNNTNHPNTNYMDSFNIGGATQLNTYMHGHSISVQSDGYTLTPGGTDTSDRAFGVLAINLGGVACWSDAIYGTETGAAPLTKAYTNPGHKPQAIGVFGSFLGELDVVKVGDPAANSFTVGFGDATDQYCDAYFTEDSPLTNSNVGAIHEATLLRFPQSDGTESTSTSVRAGLNAFTASGFDLDYNATDTSLARAFIAWTVGEATAGAAVTDADYGGMLFTFLFV